MSDDPRPTEEDAVVSNLTRMYNDANLKSAVRNARTLSDMRRALIQILVAQNGCLELLYEDDELFWPHATRQDCLISQAVPSVLAFVQKVKISMHKPVTNLQARQTILLILAESPGLTAVRWHLSCRDVQFMKLCIQALATTKSKAVRLIEVFYHSWRATEFEPMECDTFAVSSLAGLESLRHFRFAGTHLPYLIAFCRALTGHEYLEKVSFPSLLRTLVEYDIDAVQTFLDSLPRLKKCQYCSPQNSESLVHLDALWGPLDDQRFALARKALHGAHNLRSLAVDSPYWLPIPQEGIEQLPQLPFLQDLRVKSLDVYRLLEYPSLKRLHIADVPLSDVEILLKNHRRLESLELRRSLNEDEACTLFRLLEHNNGTLRRLKIWGRAESEEQNGNLTNQVEKTLRVNESLRSLILVDASSYLPGVRRAMEAEACSLEQLRLESVDLHKIEDLTALLQALPRCRTLTEFSISTSGHGFRRLQIDAVEQRRLEDQYFRTLVEVIPQLQYLRKLKVLGWWTLEKPRNGGFNETLLMALHRNQSLTHIEIGGTLDTHVVYRVFANRNRVAHMVHDDQFPRSAWPLALCSLSSKNDPSAVFSALRQLPLALSVKV